jgi:hypothetical protein
MQNLDKKVTLILNLNSKLKKSELYLKNNSGNMPKFMIESIKRVTKSHDTIRTVLENLNYLNY